MIDATEKVTRISISLPPDLDRKMRRLAHTEDISLSELYREAALLKLRTTKSPEEKAKEHAENAARDEWRDSLLASGHA